MNLLRRLAGLILLDRVRRIEEIWGELKVEPLLFCVERRQLAWFGRLIMMCPVTGFLGRSNRTEAQNTRWDYIFHLGRPRNDWGEGRPGYLA